MDLSEHDGKIKVCCRVRPIGKEVTTPFNIRDRCVVHLEPPSAPTSRSDTTASREGDRARNRRRRRDQWGFTFDDVLEDGCSQEEVYRKCAKDVVQSALSGVHGTIMACECIMYMPRSSVRSKPKTCIVAVADGSNATYHPAGVAAYYSLTHCFTG